MKDGRPGGTPDAWRRDHSGDGHAPMLRARGARGLPACLEHRAGARVRRGANMATRIEFVVMCDGPDCAARVVSEHSMADAKDMARRAAGD